MSSSSCLRMVVNFLLLLAGNPEIGTELLESLQKMAPTKEEERKLKDYRDDSPVKLGPAEKFLKAVLDVPFAFKRVDAMLYVANFETEVDYLKKSFSTLEVTFTVLICVSDRYLLVCSFMLMRDCMPQCCTCLSNLRNKTYTRFH